MNPLITSNALSQMCRLCLSRDMTMDDNIFCFSSELGKEIADIVMECAPVHITRHDEKPIYICQLCFNQLKKFHQFQLQIVRSDKELQRYLQQLNDCSSQINVELDPEEQANISESQNYNADAITKCEPFEINDEVNNLFSKQKVTANFSSVNKVIDEIPIKLEIKDEPMNDYSLIPTDCADTAETLPTYEDDELSCKDSIIEVGDTKIEYFECPIKSENDITEKIPLKSKEMSISDSSLCSENVKDVESFRSIEGILNRTEHSIKRQNLNEESQDDGSVLLKKSTASARSQPYLCDICQKCFKYAQDLKRHKLIHAEEKQYQCDICIIWFRTAQNLRSHKLIHTGEKPHQCDICQMRFRQANQLKLHKLIHTGEKPYQCDICEMSFRTAQNLKSHKLVHTGEKPYKCDICQMCFRQASHLKKHKLLHTGEKPHQRNVCQICFKHGSHLKCHKIIHTEEKPYQCNICQMRFRQSTHLKIHNLKHTGEKPYQCDICQMRFRHPTSLKNHTLIHTGEKPLQCYICQMRFRQAIQLKKHISKHTEEKPY